MSDLLDGDIIEQVARELRRPVHVDPAFDARVMAAIARERSVLRRAFDWLVEPRTVALSPLGGLALAAGFSTLVAAGTLRVRGTDRPAAAGAAPASAVATTAVRPATPIAAETRMVRFVFVAPSASSVALVGDFNDWDAQATPLRPAAPGGLWSVAIPIHAGQHRYGFVVDGTTWKADPAAPPAIGDDFGAPKSSITVSAETTS